MSSFTEALQFKPNADETSEIDSLVLKIEDQMKLTLGFSAELWQKHCQRIAPNRLLGSSTLKRGEIHSWVEANNWMANQVQDQPHPSFQDILQIQKILLPENSGPQIRTLEAYLGPWKTCPASELPQAFSEFESKILKSTHYHPLIKAALVHYWLVSLHPFTDANGRTAVLASDWILTAENYLPQTFESQLDAVVGFVTERMTQYNSARAVLKILNNVFRSYQ